MQVQHAADDLRAVAVVAVAVLVVVVVVGF